MAEGGSGDDVACPPSFLDPVTYEIMRDPVFTANDGQTFERATIEQWLQTHDTSPLHGGRLEDTRLVPNIALRKSIEEWRTKHHKIIPMSAIVIGAQIGRGSFKVVHRGTLTLPGARAPTEVAVLRVRTTDVAAEAGTLLQLGQHPRLVRFFGQCEDELDTVLITECITRCHGIHPSRACVDIFAPSPVRMCTQCAMHNCVVRMLYTTAHCSPSRNHLYSAAVNSAVVCTTVANPAVSFARPCSQ